MTDQASSTLSASRSAVAIGLATIVRSTGAVLDTFSPAPALGDSALAEKAGLTETGTVRLAHAKASDLGGSSLAGAVGADDPRGVVDILTLSRAGYRKMLQNLAWATGYNVIGLPLAAGVLAGVGFLMPPAVGAVVMSVSTIVVALNAQLLRRPRSVSYSPLTRPTVYAV